MGVVEESMSVVCESYQGGIVVMYLILFEKGNLCILSWIRMRRVMRISVSLELIMRGGGVRSILWLDAIISVPLSRWQANNGTFKSSGIVVWYS